MDLVEGIEVMPNLEKFAQVDDLRNDALEVIAKLCH
jgi:hypothetical protein